MEYRLRTVEEKNPPTTDEGRVDYLRSAASLLASVPGAVEREVYAARVAEKAGVSREAVLQEVARLRKKRLNDARRREEREAMQPSRTAQPAPRSIRYDDPRSARAEEGLIRLLYLDPGVAKGHELPPPESFSSPLLARLYRELLRRVQTGESVSIAVLSGQFTSDEMSHFTTVLNAPEDLSHADKALADYIQVITGRTESDEDDLRALAEKYRKNKAYGG
jgi:DNA primase